MLGGSLLLPRGGSGIRSRSGGSFSLKIGWVLYLSSTAALFTALIFKQYFLCQFIFQALKYILGISWGYDAGWVGFQVIILNPVNKGVNVRMLLIRC